MENINHHAIDIVLFRYEPVETSVSQNSKGVMDVTHTIRYYIVGLFTFYARTHQDYSHRQCRQSHLLRMAS